ncbi:Ada metal-binding domain-containing protein [Mitsuaria sp. GD03876]|uniref:DNA-3-methyladenine glycosylase 2 family protein n=1 Tax=Mitsuaria sp. GD03876 TaxID=2975399 RepID=UPI00244B71DE|nr:Ada metal-binding domain-containing protein [Mitsuaria sp. GD03876]MDH0866708.1 helix-turn-helix domain-containing protein [Mitsuaria sp. GD03876]
MDFLLDPDHCYPALLARDARFDGQWFVGVTSTGVYCRPICRVRTPRRENCRFFPSATLAEAARFRPCLKCRPELAPAARPWSTMDAAEVLAREAARWLDECAPEDASLPALAAHLGVSERHVRRVFTAVHGVAPLQYLQTRRLLLAKQLLTDTRLSIAEVALAAGFSSLRRFNAAFLEHYRLSPTALRKGGSDTDTASGRPGLAPSPALRERAGGEGEGSTAALQTAELRLDLRPPFQGTALLAFLAARAVPGVEQVDVERLTLSRSVRLVRPGQPDLLGWLNLRLSPDGAERPQVRLSLSPSLWPAIAPLMPRLRRWLDLDADPQAIAAALGEDLGPAAAGLRLPGSLDRFELAIRAVLGQQVTVAAARTLATRLIAKFGEPLPDSAGAPPGVTHVFPTPATLAAATVDDIAPIGMPGRRAEALIHLARQWPTLAFAQGRGTVEEAIAELAALPGLGPWTAHYMLMRGWSWPDAYLPGDVVLKQCLEQRAGTPLRPRELIAAAEHFAPYRSYAVLQLWREAALKPRKGTTP